MIKPLLLPLCFVMAWLAGCAVPRPDAALPAPPAERWHGTLPHGGDVGVLTDWWGRFDDPLLPELITQAQSASPTMAQALARVNQARATLRAHEAGRRPSMNASAQASRASNASTNLAPVSQASVGVDAQWELDLFGGVRQAIAASQARAQQARLGWHDTRISLAAEVAQTYVGFRSCEALAAVYDQEAQSQNTSASLTREKVRVGFETPANGALAAAAAAQVRDRLRAQNTECDVAVKSLVLLTGQAEPALRERLAWRRAALPQPGAFALPSVPATLLAQRPDVAGAERELVAAAADVAVAEADRYPRLTFSGTVAVGVVRAGGTSNDAVTWGFGPSLVLPLFDGGRRVALRDAAQARYDEAYAALDQRLRVAVREVEESLLRVDSAQQRMADAQIAAQGFRDFFAAAETRWRVGAGSLIEMEDARRTALAAQAGLIGVQRERVAAWISLYRAAGGGWSADPEQAPAAATPTAMKLQ